MDQVLTNGAACDKPATRQAKNLNIILGPHRLRDCTEMEALAMAHNGQGYIRRGNDLTLISSEAYAQEERS